MPEDIGSDIEKRGRGMTDKKLIKIWSSAPDMDMMPEQIEKHANDLKISPGVFPAYIRRVAEQALRGKIVSHMMSNNQMFMLVGFMVRHSDHTTTTIRRLYDNADELLDDLMKAKGVINVYEGFKGKSIITVTNKAAQWTYEVYRIAPDQNQRVKKKMYALPKVDESALVFYLMGLSDVRRNGWISEILNTENVLGVIGG